MTTEPRTDANLGRRRRILGPPLTQVPLGHRGSLHLKAKAEGLKRVSDRTTIPASVYLFEENGYR